MSLAHLTSTHRIKVERKSTTRDTSGGQVNTWDLLHEVALVTIQPTTAREKLLFSQRNIDYTNKVYSAKDLGLGKLDRVTDLSSGKEYVVTAAADQAGKFTVFCYTVREIE